MTGRYHETDPMSDVISDDYRMLQMISRFGITLGFGDKTVAETCKEANVDAQTFITVVNFLTDTNHAHINEMVEHIDLPTTLRYLQNSHTYFIDYRLPAIRRKLLQAIDMRSQIAVLILKFYDEYMAEVTRHMEYENTHVHPYVEKLLQGRRGVQRLSDITSQHEGSHTSIDRSLTELKSIIIKYYPSDQNAALLGDALMDIYMVEEDFLNHCHMEDTLFAECVHRLEREIEESGEWDEFSGEWRVESGEWRVERGERRVDGGESNRMPERATLAERSGARNGLDSLNSTQEEKVSSLHSPLSTLHQENTPSTIHFSLSHCREAVACVIDDRPCGIDIESVERKVSDSLIHYSMNEEEIEEIKKGEPEGTIFLHLWTRKEAVLKLIGTGIRDTMKDVLINCPYDIETRETERYIVSIAVSRA